MIATIPPLATSIEDRVQTELKRIIDAAKRKENKIYPANTSLILFFDDMPPFQEVINDEKLDRFVNENILILNLSFSAIYLVGRFKETFREFDIIKKQ